jgi:tRNA G46 methylase TrmB
VEQTDLGEQYAQRQHKRTFWQNRPDLCQAVGKNGAPSSGSSFPYGDNFWGLPDRANILYVGAGTGAEMIQLAQTFPQWTFTPVDPSGAVLEVCRQRLDTLGMIDRCTLQTGFVETLAPTKTFDAATGLLVSQTIMDKTAQIASISK